MEALAGLLCFVFGAIFSYIILKEEISQKEADRKLDYIYKEIRKAKKR